MCANLLEETLRLAREAKLPVPEICRAAGVKQRWYYRLLNGDFEDPGVRRIQRLHDALRSANETRAAQ